MTPGKKLERALRDNLLLRADPPEGMAPQILVSGGREIRQLPCITLQAAIETTEGFEGTNSGEWVAELSASVMHSPDDSDRADVDKLEGWLFDHLNCVSNIREQVNLPTTGDDERPVKGIYVYDMVLEGQGMDEVDERTVASVLVFRIPFRSDDGDGDDND